MKVMSVYKPLNQNALKFYFYKLVLSILVFSLVLTLSTSVSIALTSGPSSPEFQGPASSGTSDMVNLFTGDLNYQIPLFTLPGPQGGYSFNLSYDSSVAMGQEASWVGWGWSLQPGSITRQMRGLPDDFSGDSVKTEKDLLDNRTYGLGLGANVEIFGGDTSEGLPLDLGGKIYFNNYKGFGVAASIGSNFAITSGVEGGFSLNLDSFEGLTASPSLSYSRTIELNESKHKGTASLSGSINSRQGLSGIRLGMKYTPPHEDGSAGKPRFGTSISGSSTALSFSDPAHIPYIGTEMDSKNYNLNIKVGLEGQGVFGSIYVNGFYSTQKIKNKKIEVPAYGYLYHELSYGDDESLTDFNREGDGPLRKNSPNLAIPKFTYDLYNVSATGLGGTFRAFRTAVPVLTDRAQSSESAGFSLGVEVGPGGIAHLGVDGGYSPSESRIGKWLSGDDNLTDKVKSKSGDATDGHYVFKFVGEPTVVTEDMSENFKNTGGNKAVRVKLREEDADYGGDIMSGKVPYPTWVAQPQFEGDFGAPIDAKNWADNERIPRASVIQEFTNGEIKNLLDVLPELFVDIDENGVADIIDRPNKYDHHIGAFIITSNNGTRYVFALPVYNYLQEEHLFSADVNGVTQCSIVYPEITDPSDENYNYKINNTQKFLNITKLPAYTTAHLLTAVLGPGYTDMGRPGISTEDMGYWVKFKYDRKHGPGANNVYKWRAPFLGANFSEGYKTTLWDDKGSFLYGEKEVYYLASAETASHIALFDTGSRTDARGAVAKLQNASSSSSLGKELNKLNWIKLFSKEEFYLQNGSVNSNSVPIKTVNLDYNYKLNQGVPNSSVTENVPDGKLTLDNLYFTYKNNSRGELSKYKFYYGEDDTDLNPDFTPYGHQDRWGTYRDMDSCGGIDFPYTNQLLPPETASDVEKRDKYASAWQLRGITLPSGGTIDVDYEADSYKFVQDKIATQMFEIKGFSTPGTLVAGALLEEHIYFDLESPIEAVSSSVAKEQVGEKYFEGLEQVYFKVLVDIKNLGSEFAYVGGYARIKDFGVGECTLLTTGPGCKKIGPGSAFNEYKSGWIRLEKMDGFHPFSMAAWQHLRLNQPELIKPAPFAPGYETSLEEDVLQVLALADTLTGPWDEIGMLFMGFNRWANLKNYGKNINLSKSWIRLNSPDRIKFGGGSRVKRVTISDDWNASSGEPSAKSGIVYNYNMVDGRTSGVAAYEPQIGGEENPLRAAKFYTHNMALTSDLNLFHETPVNKGFFPAPKVGYSRVTTRSLASEAVMNDQLPSSEQLPKVVPTTGETVHEFYTARDFPVRVDETEIVKEPYKLRVPIPFIGQLEINNLTASQGYAIILNDMHGKAKKVSSYQFKYDPGSIGGNEKITVFEEPVSSVEYHYNATQRRLSEEHSEYYLDSGVSLLKKDGIVENNGKVGRDYDFYIDMRRSRTEAYDFGINVNTDIIFAFIPVPIPVPWPNVGWSLTELNTVTTNKITHQSGILMETEVRDGSSVSKNKNLVFDYITGRPLLTSKTNNYDAPVYNYSMPAHWHYEDGMGPSYLNISKKFYVDATPVVTDAGIFSLDVTDELRGMLVAGDEFAVLTNGDQRVKATLMNTVTGSAGDRYIFHTNGAPGELGKKFSLTRSGRRNILNAEMGMIRALDNPLDPANISTENCTLSGKEVYCGHCSKLAKKYELFEGIRRLLISLGGDILDFGGLLDYDKVVIKNGQLKLLKGGKLKEGKLKSKRAVTIAIYDDLGRKVNPLQIEEIGTIRYTDELEIIGAAVPSNLKFQNIALGVRIKDGTVFQTAYVFSNGGPFVRAVGTYIIEEVAMCPTEYNEQIRKINGVLDATAIRFGDDWPRSAEDVRYSGTIDEVIAADEEFNSRNDYAKGIKGIWRPRKHYTYVTERNQAAGLNLRRDGSFDEMVLFDWNLVEQEACAPDWRYVKESTRFSPQGFQLEEKNILDLYSTVIYGYRGTVLVAVAKNAGGNDQIGFEGFEEYGAGENVESHNVGTGNIDFETKSEEVQRLFALTLATARTEVVNARIYGNYIELNNLASVVNANEPFSSQRSGLSEKTAEALLVGDVSKIESINVPGLTCPLGLEGISRGLNDNPVLVVNGVMPGCGDVGGGAIGELKEKIEMYKGEIEALVKIKIKPKKKKFFPAVKKKNIVEISSVKAHTGKNSLKVSEAIGFTQNSLSLAKGQEYVLSVWVSRDDTDTHTFRGLLTDVPLERIGLQVVYVDSFDEISVTSPPVTLEPEGPVIEGWQRIEGTFILPEDEDVTNIRIYFQNGKDGDGSFKVAYFDDLRLFPSDASMATHVYDPQDYKLKATLDNNNFATFYSYDEEGSLFLIRKETVGGIKTLQESISHSRERP